MSPSSPLRQALLAGTTTAAAGVAYRFLAPLVASDLRTWALVWLAPVAAAAAYVRATGRDPFPAALLLALGLASGAFWALILVTGRVFFDPGGWAGVVVILLFPASLVAMGLLKWRRGRT